MGVRYGDSTDDLARDLRAGATREPVQQVVMPPAHPLVQLQRDAGNAAVSQLLSLQRHALVPEEEAGS